MIFSFKLLVINLVTLALLSGCSSIIPINGRKVIPSKNGSRQKYDNVDLELEGSENISIVKPEETVRVGGINGGSTYVNNTVDSSINNERKVRIGMSLGPGLYKTVNYVSVLKVLDKKNLFPEIITGTGFGAILAVMYASGMTSESIEWSFYKYFKDKKKNRPYQKDWVEEIDKFFLSRFKNVNLQDLKKKCFLTLYDHKTDKTYYFDKGNIRDLLLLNFRLSTNAVESVNGQKYTTAFEREVFNAKLLKSLGADYVIAVDSLGSKIVLEEPNEYLFGIYAKVSTRISKEKKDFNFLFSLPLESIKLDSGKDAILMLQKSQTYTEKQIPKMLLDMQNIKEDILGTQQ